MFGDLSLTQLSTVYTGVRKNQRVRTSSRVDCFFSARTCTIIELSRGCLGTSHCNGDVRRIRAIEVMIAQFRKVMYQLYNSCDKAEDEYNIDVPA